MRKNLVRIPLVVFCISFFHLFPATHVHSEETGLMAGGFQWNGDIELGYRFTDIDGSKARYKEVVNLQEGLKLFDLSLIGRKADETAAGPVDYFRFNLSDIGDPFPSGRLEVRKKKTYDFLASYQQYDYFTNREENGFATDNFSFDSTFGRGTLLVSVFPKEDIKLNFGYNLVQRNGDASVPRPFFLVQEQELKERLNEYFISADFSIGAFDFFIKQDYWNFKNKDEIDGPYQSEDRNETTNTYVSTLRGHTQLGERWDLDAGYIYAHSQGTAELTTSPEVYVDSGKGTTNFNTQIAELGLSYLLTKNLIFHGDYRFHYIDQNGRANTDTLLSAPTSTGSAFNLMAQTGIFQLEYTPRENLTLRGGYEIQYEDVNADPVVDSIFNGGKNPNDQSTWNNGLIASADWKPFEFLSLYGEYAGAKFSNPYTYISPESQSIAKFKAKYDTPIKSLSLQGSAAWTRRVNPDQDYTRDLQAYTITAVYLPMETLALDGSVTYEKILDGKDILTPVGPLVFYPHVDFDSSAYIFSGGVSWDIYRGFGASFRGNYANTLQENPQAYADGVLSFWYKNPWVTPIVALERTYLIDNVNSLDSFSANLLTLSLRKDF